MYQYYNQYTLTGRDTEPDCQKRLESRENAVFKIAQPRPASYLKAPIEILRNQWSSHFRPARLWCETPLILLASGWDSVDESPYWTVGWYRNASR